MSKLKYTKAQLQKLADEYAERMQFEEKFVPTINGLATHLKITRRGLLKAREREDELQPIYEDLVQKIEAWWEAKLATRDCTGAIFWLKNQGWTDRQTTEITGGLNINKMSDAELDAKIMDLMNNVPMMQTIKAPGVTH